MAAREIIRQQDPSLRRKLALAEALRAQGNANQNRTGLETLGGLAQVLSGKIVGDRATKQIEDKAAADEALRRETLAQVIAQGKGLPAKTQEGTIDGKPVTVDFPERKGNTDAMAAILAGSRLPEMQDMGLQLQLSQIEQQRQQALQQQKSQAALAKEEREFGRDKELLKLKGEIESQSGSSNPAAVREFKFFKSLNPEEQKEFLAVKRAQKTLNLGGSFGVLDSQGNVTNEIQKTLSPEQLPETKAAQVAATEQAKIDVSKEAGRGKAASKLSAEKSKQKVLDNAFNDVDRLISDSTTGLSGQLFSKIGGTSSNDLSNALGTIRANIGFDKLQSMRDQSPTGGALGQVSELENRLLQQTSGSIEQSQSTEQLKLNIDRLKLQVQESWQRVADAYEQDFGTPLPDGISPVEIERNIVTDTETQNLEGQTATNPNTGERVIFRGGQWQRI